MLSKHRLNQSQLLLDSAVRDFYEKESTALIPVWTERSCIKCGNMSTYSTKRKYGQIKYPQWYRVRGNTFQCGKCYNRQYWRKSHPKIERIHKQ